MMRNLRANAGTRPAAGRPPTHRLALPPHPPQTVFTAVTHRGVHPVALLQGHVVVPLRQLVVGRLTSGLRSPLPPPTLRLPAHCRLLKPRPPGQVARPAPARPSGHLYHPQTTQPINCPSHPNRPAPTSDAACSHSPFRSGSAGARSMKRPRPSAAPAPPPPGGPPAAAPGPGPAPVSRASAAGEGCSMSCVEGAGSPPGVKTFF